MRRWRCRCCRKDPVFAIDSAMAKNWWVKPFLRFTRAMPLDPTKPMATRTLINAVKGGEPLIIFPEGRITVTGSLMKVYDGAGLIADKTDAFVVPVRLEGLDATPFTRLSQGPGPPPLVPQGHGDRARAGEAHGRSGAQGQAPPHRGGRGALRDHVEPRLPHHVDRAHRGRGADRGGRDPRHGPRRGRGPARRHAELPQAADGRAHPRRKADAARARGQADRPDAAERQRRRGDADGADVGRPRAGDDQLHRRRRQRAGRLQGGARSTPS